MPVKPGSNHPFLLAVSSHWVSLAGLALALTALISWMFVLPVHVRGHVGNPYIGILVFIMIPAIFFAGLALIPLGIFLGRRRIKKGLAQAITDPKLALRRLAWFLGSATLLNLIVGTQFTYRAVEHMESVQFCGQTCHVMTPEFSAFQNSPHSRLQCVDCHVAPGVEGWVASKVAGSRQLMAVVLNNYHRPIASALESDRLVPANETCEQCHWPDKFSGALLRVVPKYADDEGNTESQTVLTMLIGGNKVRGIHGSHFGNGIKIRYAAADRKRQSIPWVEYTNSVTGQKRDYLATDTPRESVKDLPVHEMQCVDCHNRPTHTFELPERGVDKALALGEIPVSLPYVKKQGVQILKASYVSNAEASSKIPTALTDYYRQNHPALFNQRSREIETAGTALASIYNRNVFPDLKVTWGTYPNNLGHTDFPGCFRCHDERKESGSDLTLTQDCSACHEMLAEEEPSAKILETLGLAGRLKEMKKHNP
jgi:nitrate/TMAO reductase-like tetraheme cytochrome c subunit